MPFEAFRLLTTTIERKIRIATPRVKKPPQIKVHEQRIVLAYPFVSAPRAEHSDLLAVNDLIPAWLPGREDVCQEIMVALLENRITINQLKLNRSDVNAFVRQFKRENMESNGYAISLDCPMYDGRSWHDVLADPATL